MMYTIAWFVLMLGVVLAIPLAVLMEKQAAKKREREAMMEDEEAEVAEDAAADDQQAELLEAEEEGGESAEFAPVADDAVAAAGDQFGDAEPLQDDFADFDSKQGG